MSKSNNTGQRPAVQRGGLLLAAGLVAVVPSANADATIAWRFQMGGSYAAHRGAIAADGTVYVQDVLGTVYALTPTGQLQWNFDPGGLAEGPIVLGADGTLYVSGNPGGPDVRIFALNPDGTVRWMFIDPGVTQGVIAGPAVGPDGNIYAVTDLGGLGALSVSGATGALRWHNVGNPQLTEYGQTGAEITFGPVTPGGSPDHFFVAFDLVGTGGIGKLFAFNLGGSQNLSVSIGGDANVGQFQPAAGSEAAAVYVSSLVSSQGYRLRAFDADSGSALWSYPGSGGTPTNRLSQPTVGPDGAIYVMRNGGEIHAVNPDGTNRWTYTSANLFGTPVAAPTNDIVVAAGQFGLGQPGMVKGFDAASGQLRWTVTLPAFAGSESTPYSRPWFSADGRRVYFTATLLTSTEGGFLYAIDTQPSTPGDIDGDGNVDLSDLALMLSSFGACAGDSNFGPAADFDGSGCIELVDLAVLLANFGR